MTVPEAVSLAHYAISSDRRVVTAAASSVIHLCENTRKELMRTPLLWLLLTLTLSTNALAAPLGSAFSYQGRLLDAGTPATGSYDFRFALYSVELGGAPLGTAHTNENLAVSNGVFTTAIDFGSNTFDGAAYWLEISTRPGTNTGDFTVLTPRQRVMPVPYALHALSASAVPSVSWGTL